MVSDINMKKTLQAYIDAYNRNSLDELLALFSDDATVEDPYGTPTKIGRNQITGFYKDAMATGAKLHLSAPIRGSHGNAAAMAFDAIVNTPKGEIKASVIDVMTFDDAGKIKSMRAYFGPSDLSGM